MKTPYSIQRREDDRWFIEGPTHVFTTWHDQEAALSHASDLNAAYSEGLREGAQGIAGSSPQRSEDYSGEPGPTKEDAPKNNEEQSEDAALPDGRLSDEEIERLIREEDELEYAGTAPLQNTWNAGVRAGLRYYRDHINKSTI